MYDQETILKEIRTKWAGKTVHFAKETDSTNEWAKRLSQERRASWNAGCGRISERGQRPSGKTLAGAGGKFCYDVSSSEA